MTHLESVALSFDCKGPKATPHCCPVIPNTVAPIDPDVLAHLKQPAGNPHFNSMSNNDVRMLHELRDCDTLHRADRAAALSVRGKNLNELARNIDSKTFVGSYLRKK